MREAGGSWDEDDLRAEVRRVSDQPSTRELTFEQARELIDGLERMLGRDPAAQRRRFVREARRRRGADGAVSVFQLKQIESLARALEWTVDGEPDLLRIRSFCERQLQGKAAPETSAEAQVVIQGMKSIARRNVAQGQRR